MVPCLCEVSTTRVSGWVKGAKWTRPLTQAGTDSVMHADRHNTVPMATVS